MRPERLRTPPGLVHQVISSSSAVDACEFADLFESVQAIEACLGASDIHAYVFSASTCSPVVNKHWIVERLADILILYVSVCRGLGLGPVTSANSDGTNDLSRASTRLLSALTSRSLLILGH